MTAMGNFWAALAILMVALLSIAAAIGHELGRRSIPTVGDDRSLELAIDFYTAVEMGKRLQLANDLALVCRREAEYLGTYTDLVNAKDNSFLRQYAIERHMATSGIRTMLWHQSYSHGGIEHAIDGTAEPGCPGWRESVFSRDLK